MSDIFWLIFLIIYFYSFYFSVGNLLPPFSFLAYSEQLDHSFLKTFYQRLNKISFFLRHFNIQRSFYCAYNNYRYRRLLVIFISSILNHESYIIFIDSFIQLFMRVITVLLINGTVDHLILYQVYFFYLFKACVILVHCTRHQIDVLKVLLNDKV